MISLHPQHHSAERPRPFALQRLFWRSPYARQFTSTVLIAITGYDTPEARALSAAAGFDHHIWKPVNFDELVRLLS
jgi:CheY-like chemotaxis protein